MTVVLFLLLLFLQQGNSEETLLSRNNKTSLVNITTSEETCEKVAEMCTYNLPRMDEIPDYEQCQVIFLTDLVSTLISISSKDKRVRENRGYFMANSIVVILLGSFTNLFNLVAFVYVYYA